jgi:hypothetical protein
VSRVARATHCALALLVSAAAIAPAPARGEVPEPPAASAEGLCPHGSIAAGGALLLTGDRGDRLRGELSADCKRGRRLGVLAAWRAPDEGHRGLVTAGLTFEGGAARPRLVLTLHADLGIDLDAGAPLAGGGIRTTLGLVGALGVVLDAGGYLVIDGVAETRLQLQSSTSLAVRW